MSAPVTPTPATPAKKFNVVAVHGRVEDVQRFEGVYRTRLICPAADEFTAPQKVIVRSKARLGSKDEMIEISCRLGGYQRKPYRVTDKDTGEQTNVTPVDMTLDHIE